MSNLRLMVAGFLYTCVTITVRLAVIWMYWKWFFVPLGAPLISLPQAVGLTLFAEFVVVTIRPVNTVTDPLTVYVDQLKKEKDKTIVGAVWVLGLGALASYFS